MNVAPTVAPLPSHVQYGFSSTTTDRVQALHYAEGKASTVFEMEMGMVDRGADLGWLSQCNGRSPQLPDLSGGRSHPPTHKLSQIRTSRRSSSRR